MVRLMCLYFQSGKVLLLIDVCDDVAHAVPGYQLQLIVFQT